MQTEVKTGKKKDDKQYKVTHGAHMIGACMLMFHQKMQGMTDLSTANKYSLIAVYLHIVTEQLQYRKNYALIRSDSFPAKETTRKKAISILRGMGFIDYTRTQYKGAHALTKFWVLNVDGTMDDFKLVNSLDKPDESKQPITTDELHIADHYINKSGEVQNKFLNGESTKEWIAHYKSGGCTNPPTQQQFDKYLADKGLN